CGGLGQGGYAVGQCRGGSGRAPFGCHARGRLGLAGLIEGVEVVAVGVVVAGKILWSDPPVRIFGADRFGLEGQPLLGGDCVGWVFDGDAAAGEFSAGAVGSLAGGGGVGVPGGAGGGDELQAALLLGEDVGHGRGVVGLLLCGGSLGFAGGGRSPGAGNLGVLVVAGGGLGGGG